MTLPALLLTSITCPRSSASSGLLAVTASVETRGLSAEAPIASTPLSCTPCNNHTPLQTRSIDRFGRASGSGHRSDLTKQLAGRWRAAKIAPLPSPVDSLARANLSRAIDPSAPVSKIISRRSNVQMNVADALEASLKLQISVHSDSIVSHIHVRARQMARRRCVNANDTRVTSARSFTREQPAHKHLRSLSLITTR